MLAAGSDARRHLVVGRRDSPSLSRAKIDSICARASLDASAVREPALQKQPARSAALEARGARVVVGRGLHAGELKPIDHHQRHPELGRNAGHRPGEAGGATPTMV